MSNSNKVQSKPPQDKSYKMVVFRSEDMMEVRTFDLTIGNIYALISGATLLLGLLIVAILVFTPLKKLIPGYGKIEANEDFLTLIDEVNDMNRVVEDQEIYLTALRKMLVSNGDSTEQEIVVPIAADTMSGTASTSVITDAQVPKYEVTLTKDLSDSDALWKSIENDKPRAPVEGIISVKFDPLIKHYGVDVLAPAETPVRSILDGYIISSGWDLETGYTIGVQHKGEIISFYKHNSILLKEKGTFVSAGEALAIIGNSGTLTSGPHLHFEFWHHGKPINPEDIINFN